MRSFVVSCSLALLGFAQIACGSSDQTTSSASSSGTTTTSSSTTSSSSSSGSGGSGGSGGAYDTTPINAPKDQWTWVDFPNNKCANGSPTGIGINPTDKSKKVFIFLQGGGACWSDLTCNILKTAIFTDTGYSKSDFDSEMAAFNSLEIFSRTKATNPFKDASYVFVPYCTGDVHAGDTVQMYQNKPFEFHGRRNIEAMLARVAPTFPNADRVIFSGSSAGGFGAGLNWWQARKAFGPNIRVDLIDDSGQPLPPPYLSTSQEMVFRDAWNVAGALPPDCAACTMSFSALFDYYKDHADNTRAALLSYTEDTTISNFFAISTTQFAKGLDELATKSIDPNPKMKYFFLGAKGHVLLTNLDNTTNGQTLRDWINQMESDDPAWKSQHP